MQDRPVADGGSSSDGRGKRDECAAPPSGAPVSDGSRDALLDNSKSNGIPRPSTSRGLPDAAAATRGAGGGGGSAKKAGGAEIAEGEENFGAPFTATLDLEALMRRAKQEQQIMRAGGGAGGPGASPATSYRGAALHSCAYSAKCFGAEASSLACDDAALAAVGVEAEARLWRLFATSGLRSPLALSVAAVRGCLQLLLSVTSAAEAGELAAVLRAAGFVTAPGAGADAPLTVVPGPRLLRTLLEGGLGASTSHVHVSAGGGLWGATLQRQQAGGPAAALQLDTDAAAAAAVEGLPPLRIECIEPAAVALLAPFGGGVSVAVAAGRPGSSAAALQPPRPAGGEDADDPTSSTVSVKLHCSGQLDARRHRVVVTGGAAGAVKPLRVTLAGAVATLVLPRPAARTVLQLQVVEDLPARLGARVSAAAPLMVLPAAAAAELAAAVKAGGAGVADAVRDMAWLLLLLRRQQVPTAVPLGAAGAGQLTDACGCALEALLSGGLFEAAATLLDAAAAAGVRSTGMEATDAASLRAAMVAAGGIGPGSAEGPGAAADIGEAAAAAGEGCTMPGMPMAAGPCHSGHHLRSGTIGGRALDVDSECEHAPRHGDSAAAAASGSSAPAVAGAPAASAPLAGAAVALVPAGTATALAPAAAAVAERRGRWHLASDPYVLGAYVVLYPISLAWAAAHRASRRAARLPRRRPPPKRVAAYLPTLPPSLRPPPPPPAAQACPTAGSSRAPCCCCWARRSALASGTRAGTCAAAPP